MTEHGGLAGKEFHARAAELQAKADVYNARNPVQRSQRAAVTTNSNDDAVRAMTGETLAESIRRKREAQ
jgi:hypothetical protein